MPTNTELNNSGYGTGGIVYKTLEDVEAASEQYKHDKNGAAEKKGSFETDDFFDAALRRSYGNED